MLPVLVSKFTYAEFALISILDDLRAIQVRIQPLSIYNLLIWRNFL